MHGWKRARRGADARSRARNGPCYKMVRQEYITGTWKQKKIYQPEARKIGDKQKRLPPA